MNIAVFWFNIFVFTLIFGIFGLGYVMLQKSKKLYRLLYLWYIGLSGLWLILLTILFFAYTLMSSPNPILQNIVANCRILISLGLFYIIPIFLYALLYDTVALKIRLLLLILPLILFILVTVSLKTQQPILITTTSVVYNSVIGGGTFLTLYLLKKRKLEKKMRPMVSFLWISGTAYSLFAFYAILALIIKFMIPITFNLLITGLFFLTWCVNDLFVFLRELTSSFTEHDFIPERFFERHLITAREKEIINLIAAGKNYRQIGELLFISPRTVETHAYKIYRKCEVSNKVELINLIRTY